MADFISGFWNMYVMVLVTLSILFCVFVLVSNMTKREKGEVGLHGHVWDETLAEYSNPLPRWWMYLFWITINCSRRTEHQLEYACMGHFLHQY